MKPIFAFLLSFSAFGFAHAIEPSYSLASVYSVSSDIFQSQVITSTTVAYEDITSMCSGDAATGTSPPRIHYSMHNLTPTVFLVTDTFFCTASTAGTLSPRTPVNTSTTCAQTYNVVEGDTCYAIATTNNISLDQFFALNPTIDQKCTALAIGQEVCIGDGGGDAGSPSSIAPALSTDTTTTFPASSTAAQSPTPVTPSSSVSWTTIYVTVYPKSSDAPAAFFAS
jgi:LysM repeat protein